MEPLTADQWKVLKLLHKVGNGGGFSWAIRDVLKLTLSTYKKEIRVLRERRLVRSNNRGMLLTTNGVSAVVVHNQQLLIEQQRPIIDKFLKENPDDDE